MSKSVIKKDTRQVLKISSISKNFANDLVLDEINLEIESKQIFGFVGLNGMGKTTLIKIILDLLDEDRGEIEIFGINKILPKSRQKLFYLPEKFQPSPYLKGIEFLDFVFDFYGVKPDKNLLEQLCENFELPIAKLQYRIAKYSKGMTQKLGLISSFLSKADLLILDEPMSGLDSKARINLKNQLIKYRNLGKTIFFSSHILSDMDEICDKIAILNERKISFCGEPRELRDKHAARDLESAFLREIG